MQKGTKTESRCGSLESDGQPLVFHEDILGSLLAGQKPDRAPIPGDWELTKGKDGSLMAHRAMLL